MKLSILFTCLFCSFIAHTNEIDKHIEKLLKGSRVPSLSAAVIVDGKLVSSGASGIRKMGETTKVTVKDKYHVGSCTKSMTATLAAILVEKKIIKWDTRVSEVFKELKIHKGYQQVTLKDLLTNTSGVPGDIPNDLWSQAWRAKGNPSEQRLQLVKGILSQAPKYAAGQGYEYSNGGFAIAGAMLEQATGTPYEKLMTVELFKKLEMNSAGFRAPASKYRIDQPYGHKADFTPVKPEPAGDNPRAIAPAGAVHCSIEDFAKYAQFHLGSYKEDLLKTKTRALLYEATDQEAYGMGWVITERDWAGGKAFMHTGSNTMFYTVVWLAPEKDFAAVAMCNYGGKEGFEKCDAIISFMIQKYLK